MHDESVIFAFHFGLHVKDIFFTKLFLAQNFKFKVQGNSERGINRSRECVGEQNDGVAVWVQFP